MTLLGRGQCILCSVRVSVATSTMAVVVEEKQTYDIGGKTKASDNHYKHRLRDLLRLEKALYCFEEDGET